MRISEVINYNMNEKESLMAYIADSILNAFNGSYKPHCFDVECFGYGDDGSCKSLYIENCGYTMVCKEDRGQIYMLNKFIKLDKPKGTKKDENDQVYFVTDILEFIIDVANALGYKDCTKELICDNVAVQHLQESFSYKGINFFAVLNNNTTNGFSSNFIYNHFGDKPTKKELLKEFGFCYIDRGMWILDL